MPFKRFKNLPAKLALTHVVMLCSALLLFSTTRATAEPEYRLDTGDIVQITLLERPLVNGPYTIGIDGKISVPGLGTMVAAGETLRSFEAKLQALAEVTIVSPSISSQVLQYRPFYVVGDVRESGKYPFVPGLTVMQAVAIAKGFEKPNKNVDILSRTLANLRAQQSLDIGQIELIGLQARLARFKAEQANAAEFTFTPESLAGTTASALEAMIAEEQGLFDERRKAFEQSVALSRKTLEARRNETASYSSRIESQTEFLNSVSEELTETRELRAQGLVSSSRLNDLVRSEISTRGQVLQTRSLMRQAQAAESQSEQDLASLISGRQVELAQSIQTISEEISLVKARIAGDSSVLSETGGGRTVIAAGPVYRFDLYRDGAVTAKPVTLTTQLAPGDTVFVVRERSQDMQN